MEKINLYIALEEMKRISVAGGTFSFAFRKWNRQMSRGGDLVRVSHARVRSKASDEDVNNSSYKLFFTDCDSGCPMNCWQPLVVEFNGKGISL